MEKTLIRWNNGSFLIAGIPNYDGIIIENILNQFLDNSLNAIISLLGILYRVLVIFLPFNN